MNDLDKVIKGLESQLDDLSKYADADEVLTLTQNQAKDLLALLKEQEEEIENLKQTAQSMMEGICLLKEQEAVPVRQREVMHMLVWCCGSCGVAITDGDKFCRMCGRKVKYEQKII